MSDYMLIKTQCLATRTLWQDPELPATQYSVFYHDLPKVEFTWKRAKVLYPRPSFVQDKCKQFDVVPGLMGDEWLVSCLGVLYLSKGLFHRVVPANQRFKEPYAGIFRFRVWWCGQWMEVLVDDRLPTVDGKLNFLQCSHTKQLWPALLEKAYAKLLGSYEALKYGNILDGFVELTGGIAESIEMSKVDDHLLSSLLETSSIVTCSLQVRGAKMNEKRHGLSVNMSFRIYCIEQIESAEGPIRLVRLCRPPATEDVTCKIFSLPMSQLDAITLLEQDRLPKTTHPGFWMFYSDFKTLFSHVVVIYLDKDTCKDEPSLTDKKGWQMSTFQGGWKRGVTAGGCRNFIDTFHTNPQFKLVLEEDDEIVIGLNQHSITEPKVIGFIGYKLQEEIFSNMAPAFFMTNKSRLTSHYTNSRQVSQRYKLEAGVYLIMPTTLGPRHETNFTLRILSTKEVKMSGLDFKPEVTKNVIIRAPPNTHAVNFSQYEAIFLRLADEHKSIDAFELQELLDDCLPNDYIKSCATIDTCRQIVLTFDKRSNGRIYLAEFKDFMCSLKKWQSIFNHHSKDRMGVLPDDHLRDALKDVGFVLTEKMMHLIVLRYLRKDGTLRFGDFVSVILLLHRAFSVFESKSKQSQCFVAPLEEWLHLLLMC